MIVILKPHTPQDRVAHLLQWLRGQGLGTHVSEGEYHTVIGLIGDTSKVDLDLLQSLDIVEAAKHFMHENVENSIGLEAVAKYVGYSPSHFSAVFKKATGTSPLAYFNQLKIDYACQLLRETTLKVNQISYKVGIEDPLYFSRLFSKVKGMSPSRYREACNVSVDDLT